MRTFWTCILILSGYWTIAQSVVSGTITANGERLIGVNVFIKGSFDGAMTDESGRFSFRTKRTGKLSLVCTYIGYVDFNVTDDVLKLNNLNIELKETIQAMEAVTITANTISTGKNVKYESLNSLDIVTTAGANGDVMAALKTMPGTQQDDNDGRLFVKGGDADETAIYIDGLRVFSPYNRSIQGTPTRGRYSPMLFKGMNFSSSAYAPEYGDALSGVLDMKTQDMPAETTTNINLMSLGAQLGRTKKWNRQSIAFNASYINLWLYDKLLKSRVKSIKPYSGFSGESSYRYKLDKGIFKTYLAGTRGSLALLRKNINTLKDEEISIRTDNVYLNSSLNYDIAASHQLFIGGSFGRNVDQLSLDNYPIHTNVDGMHLRVGMTSELAYNWTLAYGVDYLQEKHHYSRGLAEHNSVADIRTETSSAYAKMTYYFSRKFVLHGGLRTSFSHLNRQSDFMPRFTLAHALGKSSQLTLSYGIYSQDHQAKYLVKNPDLSRRKARHFSLNYNLKYKKNTLRAELYHKDYNQLIRYTVPISDVQDLTTDGDGTAYGAELFWKSKGLLKNLDCHLSYSWVKGKRKYQDYTSYAVPRFNAEHTLSLVGKYWIDDLNSLVSMTATVASGRPYENPNTAGFLNERAAAYKNLSLSWAYLISPQAILYFSASNMLGVENEYGYRYAATPEANGLYRSEKIVPNVKRFLFVGYFLTISSDKSKNQLDNL